MAGGTVFRLLALSACALACRSVELTEERAEVGAEATSSTRSIAGTSVEGRPINYGVFGSGADTVLYLASIHGDESAGTPLLGRFQEELERRPGLLAGRRAVVVPVTNPDGVRRGSRHNAHGIDLNRNFPAKNWRARPVHGARALSEPESRAVHQLIRDFQPDLILSFHQAADLIDYDGPAGDVARELSAVSPLRVSRLGSRPGSLGSYAGLTLGLPIITVEMKRSDDDRSADELWERYGQMLIAALRHERGVAR